MKRAGIPLAGAALLVAAAFLRLPPPRDWARTVATPFDRSRDPGAGPIFVLLTRAAAIIPEGSSVAVRAASEDPAQSISCTMLAAGLLPGRRVLSAQTRIAEGRPDFLVVVGPDLPASLPGRPLLRTREGAVCRLAP